MLILDKQKAVERIVARTSAGAEADPEQQAAASADLGGRRVASYEQAAAAPAAVRTTRRRAREQAAAAPAAVATTPRRERRGRRRTIAGEPAPA